MGREHFQCPQCLPDLTPPPEQRLADQTGQEQARLVAELTELLFGLREDKRRPLRVVPSQSDLRLGEQPVRPPGGERLEGQGACLGQQLTAPPGVPQTDPLLGGGEQLDVQDVQIACGLP